MFEAEKLKPVQILDFVNKAQEWFSVCGRQYPWRSSSDPYEVGVAEILLQKTPASRVGRVYPKIIQSYPTANEMKKADVNEVMKEIATLGFSFRAKILIDFAQRVNIIFPSKEQVNFDKLLEIKGIGLYTASMVALCTRNFYVPAIDINLKRVVQNNFLTHSCYDEKKINDFALEVLSQYSNIFGNRILIYSLLDIGAIYCRPIQPKCSSCPFTKCNNRNQHNKKVMQHYK